MTSPKFKFLISGIDTAQVAYYLRPLPGCQVDFERLLLEKERLRAATLNDSASVEIADQEFLLQAYGTKSGYPLVFGNADMGIECGEFNNPSFFVTYRSEALWREGLPALHGRFLHWCGIARLAPTRPETLSRVDFAFDYRVEGAQFSPDHVVTLASKDSQHREDRSLQTMQFGRDDVVLRIYDKVVEIAQKSGKIWLFELWGVKENVWRIEWQTRKTLLKRFGLRSVQDLVEGQGDALRYLCEEHDTLRVPGVDSNRSRWSLHPLWEDLQRRVKEFNCQGVDREIDPKVMLDERLQRIAISVYGYLKRVGAIIALLEGRESESFAEAVGTLNALMAERHDPITWGADVQKRVQQMRLGS